MRLSATLLGLAPLIASTLAAPYNETYAGYNLNTNQNAQSPLDYDTDFVPSSYHPSPDNWRIPFYTVLMDKFADGDPTNNDFFGSPFEWDWRETNFRFGGDLAGLESKLDYLAGMGIKAIFASGTPWINMLWQADSYSPLDFTTLDPHWGQRDEWRSLIDAVHARGMYYVVDFTVATMGDLIAWDGFQNKSAPFDIEEHDAVYKKQKYIPWGFDQYKDFSIDNSRNTSCVFPTFFFEDGSVLNDPAATIPSDGCKASDFDQYGDLEAFGVHPDWMRQLTKFASVQDRLREWQPRVLDRLIKFSCLAIKALDFDAIRIDKATQVSVGPMADWATGIRKCAADLGKTNFFISGEVTGGNTFGALYLGRGRQPDQRPPGLGEAINVTSNDNQFFLRSAGNNGLDAVAFHYSIYRSFQRFLGLDGNLQVGYDTPVDFVDAWNTLFVQNDFINAGTGQVDPRHLYGLSNFDILRWDGIVNGTQRSALGMFIASLAMPGAPLVYYGEEQGFYLFDNTASNYLFGRQAMPSTKAWQRHGCYHLGADPLYNLPLSRALVGCQDDWNSLDHFDPTADVRRLYKQLFELRAAYPVLNDGFSLEKNGNWTYEDFLPFSNGTPTERGLWSISRGGIPALQNFSYNDTVWLLYTNENTTASYTGDCMAVSGIGGPYQGGTVVRNLFYPFENYTLGSSNRSFFFNGEAPYFGCIESLTMQPYDFKALVLATNWVAPTPALTKFVPGHDARIGIDDNTANPNSINIRIEFSDLMDCTSVTQSMNFTLASSGKGTTPSVNANSVQCQTIPDENITPAVVLGATVSRWYWNGTIDNVADGILTITINNPQSQNGVSTGATDNLLVRKGKTNNVMVFPNSDYDGSALSESGDNLVFTHNALGAEKLRYSVDFGKSWSSWSDWEDTTSIPKSLFQNKTFFWKGNHVIMNYWTKAASSAATVVHSDYGYNIPRRVPRFLARGKFNRFGFDLDVPSTLTQASDGKWELEILAGWPSSIQLNVYDFDDYFYGDTDGDGVLDRLPPNSLAVNFVNMSAPPKPHLSWTLIVDDSTMTWSLQPRGYLSISAILYGLLLFIPFLTALLAAFIFMRAHYGIKYNQFGVISGYQSVSKEDDDEKTIGEKLGFSSHKPTEIIGWPEDKGKRRKVLIATLEYEIIDWKLKVKIGGLGVMSSLMGKSMTDVDLVWVIPKVKDLEYPPGEPIDPIEVIIFGEPYLIEVEKHVLDHITYVILDSPVFRAQTKSDPYPPRMDDLSSAIYYSTWNQCIAATVKRNPDIDIYHINDYHGALAPIYLLPKVLPVCLSLHNAEFQGLWPLRTKDEMKEVCSAFNISKEHCTKYVQFGNTFNLLHAAASFISVHQNSVGVAGVSDKYGKRSWARYPALWTLKHVDSLPNPDPSDIEALDAKPVSTKDVTVDLAAEAKRPELKRQAQEWANIAQNPNADLFVFVGRWSKQKGVDLIADIMPTMLEKYPSIQLITVGPVIDLYGKFAAEKLKRLMELYPDRVYSKPEFTALPPYLFSGADFALIPSRDEPFGLVAVEFGRKGALGVGSRLGGLGLMPGWWFPVESTSTEHMLSQFKKTIKKALKSSPKERQLLRARSAVQRFPVVEWRQRTEDFHKRSINASRRQAGPDAWRERDGDTRGMLPIQPVEDWDPVHQDEPSQPAWGDHESLMNSPGLRSGNVSQENLAAGQPLLTPPPTRDSVASDITLNSNYRSSIASQQQYNSFLERANRQFAHQNQSVPDPFLDQSRASLSARPYSQYSTSSRLSSVESIATIVDEKQNSPLNKAIDTFTDKDGGVAAEFVAKLRGLDAKNSQTELSIEKFLVKSEEAFFDKVKEDKRESAASLRSQRDSYYHSDTPRSSFYSTRPDSSFFVDEMGMLSDGGGSTTTLVIPSRLQVFLSRELFGWPLYGIILAFGQMLSATSYQIVLLSGSNGETNVALYIIGAVFFVASVVWYLLFRFKPSVWVLSLPWFFFSLAFLLIGLPYVSKSLLPAHDNLSNVATWSYAVASAGGFAFFGLNFGEEAGAATEVWILRACIVQGSQQIWVAALWYWGDKLNNVMPGAFTPRWIVFIVWPLSALCFLFMILLLRGLPEYYRQTPPTIPNFYATLFRRKLVLWFLISLVLRDYWLSGSYGRNWSFLWDSVLKDWQVLILIVVFFIGVWAALLAFLTWLSKVHTWFLAIFAVGIGAPRWCQMLWGVSSVALYVPWAGGAGPWISVSLWLWLGVLDAVQGVGLGIILLQTLSRFHVCAALAFSQMLGSVVVIAARQTVPRKQVFPDFGLWNVGDGFKYSPFASVPFWVALVCQIVIVVGYFWYYRKEQLARP